MPRPEPLPSSSIIVPPLLFLHGCHLLPPSSSSAKLLLCHQALPQSAIATHWPEKPRPTSIITTQNPTAGHLLLLFPFLHSCPRHHRCCRPKSMSHTTSHRLLPLLRPHLLPTTAGHQKHHHPHLLLPLRHPPLPPPSSSLLTKPPATTPWPPSPSSSPALPLPPPCQDPSATAPPSRCRAEATGPPWPPSPSSHHRSTKPPHGAAPFFPEREAIATMPIISGAQTPEPPLLLLRLRLFEKPLLLFPRFIFAGRAMPPSIVPNMPTATAPLSELIAGPPSSSPSYRSTMAAASSSSTNRTEISLSLRPEISLSLRPKIRLSPRPCIRPSPRARAAAAHPPSEPSLASCNAMLGAWIVLGSLHAMLRAWIKAKLRQRAAVTPLSK